MPTTKIGPLSGPIFTKRMVRAYWLVVSPRQRSFHGTRSSLKNSKIDVESYWPDTATVHPKAFVQLDLTARKLVDPNGQAVQTGDSAGGGRPVSGRENQDAFVGGLVTYAILQRICAYRVCGSQR